MSIDPEDIDTARHLVRVHGLTPAEAAKELKVCPKELAKYVVSSKEPWPAKDVRAWHRKQWLKGDQRDVGSRILGDPPPGRSALDQRGQHGAA